MGKLARLDRESALIWSGKACSTGVGKRAQLARSKDEYLTELDMSLHFFISYGCIIIKCIKVGKTFQLESPLSYKITSYAGLWMAVTLFARRNCWVG